MKLRNNKKLTSETGKDGCKAEVKSKDDDGEESLTGADDDSRHEEHVVTNPSTASSHSTTVSSQLNQLPYDLRQRLGPTKDRPTEHRRQVKIEANNSKRMKTDHNEENPQNITSGGGTLKMHRKQSEEQPSTKHIQSTDEVVKLKVANKDTLKRRLIHFEENSSKKQKTDHHHPRRSSQRTIGEKIHQHVHKPKCSSSTRRIGNKHNIRKPTDRRSLPIGCRQSYKASPVHDRPMRQYKTSLEIPINENRRTNRHINDTRHVRKPTERRSLPAGCRQSYKESPVHDRPMRQYKKPWEISINAKRRTNRRINDKHHVRKPTERRSLPTGCRQSYKESPVHDQPTRQCEKSWESAINAKRRTSTSKAKLLESKFCKTDGILRALLQKGRSEILKDMVSQLDEFRLYCENERLVDRLKDDGLAVLAKICDENDEVFDQSNTKMLNILITVIQETNFLKGLRRYICQIPTRDFRQSQYYSINDLVKFCVIFTKTMVTKFQRSLDQPYIVLNAIQGILNLVKDKLTADVLLKIKDLTHFINRIKQNKVRPKYVENSDDDNDDEDIDVTKGLGNKIGSFRNIPIYPETHELRMIENQYLEPNRIGEGYKNAEHYLKVQFHLLREDMVRSLRGSIASYINLHPDDAGNLWVYKEATFCKMSTSEYGIAHTIKFKSTNRSWRKRLKFGAIVCISADRFQTIYVAVVVNRDQVERGSIDLQFLSNTDDLGTIYQHQYIMLESCSVFFESYRYVLSSLKCFKTDNFPMDRYIVENNLSDVKHPKYLRDDKDTSYNLNVILKSPEKQLNKVDIMEIDTWPSIEETVLDDSQYKAIRNALTKEVAVIQGPPGTGKTFIGLKLMEILLANRHVWCKYSEIEPESPILVVCYTNHALDQFCEGIIEKNSLTNKEFVRLGSRSKNETISKFSLANQRRSVGRSRQNRLTPIDDIVLNLNELTEGILSIETLSSFNCLNECQVKAICGSQHKSLHVWLGVGEYDKYVYPSTYGKFSLRTSLLEETIENLKVNRNSTELSRVRKLYRFLLEKLENLVSCSELAKRDASIHPRRLDDGRRWNLYAYWVEQVRQLLCKECQDRTEHNNEVRINDDFEILSGKKVIAATTSAASKNAVLLSRLKPKIVIVEEAARVLEAHVLTALTGHCDHLIMIGDHQQLRPETATYDLRKRYHLDISLFERLILNGLDYDQLKYQHRMPLNVSNIVRTVFYTNLRDTSRTDNVNIPGVATNLMLIDHQNNESCDLEIRSRSNQHEAKFIIAFSVFLVQQGCEAEKITMLTPYLGQSNLLWKLSKSEPLLGHVKIKVLDDYQGEENDIIMLSLVRSNDRRMIGFLKDEKRICVMLSRAKKAMYCIGNFQMLESRNPTWKRVVAIAKRSKVFGKYVKVMCKQHPEFSVEVTSSTDFRKLPDGGCPTPCDHRLECGHVCPRTCHPHDQSHSEVICPKTCDKPICIRGHTCDYKCGMQCRINCIQEVRKELPCGHFKTLKCYEDPEVAKCLYVCLKKLPCGHDCEQKCYETCDENKCKIIVKKTNWSCGHEVTVACSTGQTSCPQPCKTILKCGHICKGKCGKCINGRIHVPCREKCLRTLVCGHVCNSNCCQACPPCKKDCENRCRHSSCKKKCGDRCVPCREMCQWSCEHATCTKTCGKPCNRQRCDEACTKTLHCTHPCIGMCGEPCPKKCRICDKEEVKEIFFGTEDDDSARFIEINECGHIIEVRALDSWMELAQDNNDPQVTVQLKGCPKCKTTIRNSLRYGDVIKSRFNDIESVKEKIKGERERDSVIKSFPKRCRTGFYRCGREVHVPIWLQKLIRDKFHKDASLQEIIDLRNKVEFVLQLHTIKLNLCLFHSAENYVDINARAKALENVLEKYKNDILSEQQLYDIEIQLRWMQAAINYLKLKNTPKSEDDLKEIKNILDHNIHFPSDFSELTSLFDTVKKRSGLGISDDERIMIVKAMDLAKGHWYKCPNNHVYAIGDCGGANQESTCPECKEAIGGTQHRLTSGNEVASEMDGARYSAWSEQANLENYDQFQWIN
ncbi:NFX1-type zinc finger-containing protein 1-like [Anneissia japonica]|uniref:NFX1-type zinc finger-containing protein 1-like n=1 Tax=Anneissia japonica TaxID=1529436 RepID=UPI001425A851|nr:NFX1-type zinc finger-containing protein 1-like [Anneissia japonica]